MKNIYFILLFILLISCEKKPIKINDNIPIINNQDIVETDQINEDNDFQDNNWSEIIEIKKTSEHNDFLVGKWIKEWDYPFSSFDDTKTLYEVNLCKVNIYDFVSPVYILSTNGDYWSNMSGLSDGGSAYNGSWYLENSELIINGYIDDESGDKPKFYKKYKILSNKDNILYLLNGNNIEKWVNNVDIELMVGFLYWKSKDVKDYLERNSNPTLLYERTPLMWAFWGQRDLIDYLIETSKNINNVDIFKRNAAHYAIIEYQGYQKYQSRLIEILKKLKEKEINFEAVDIYGKTPFDYFESEKMKLEIQKDL